MGENFIFYVEQKYDRSVITSCYDNDKMLYICIINVNPELNWISGSQRQSNFFYRIAISKRYMDKCMN